MLEKNEMPNSIFTAHKIEVVGMIFVQTSMFVDFDNVSFLTIMFRKTNVMENLICLQ